MLKLRKASQADCDLLFRWANEYECRRNSFSPEPILYKNHCKWLEKILERKDVDLFLLESEEENRAIGMLRLEYERDSANISYSIDKDNRGKGYGKKLLMLAEEFVKENRKENCMAAKVKRENKISNHLFVSLGYKEVTEEKCITYSKKIVNAQKETQMSAGGRHLKGIVIGASADAIHAIKTAKNQGVYVIAVDGSPKALGLSYGDKSLIVDISDTEAVSKVIEEEKPDFVIPVPVGRFLDTAGYINEQYGFKGIGYTPVHNSTDKLLFHEKLSQLGLRNSHIQLLQAGTKEIAYEGNYPVIIKPRHGSGSRNVFCAENETQLKSRVKELDFACDDFVVEEMKKGTEYGMDAVVIEGCFSMLLLRKKTLTPLPVRQAISYTSVSREEAVFQRVYSHMEKVVKAMEYNNCIMHADILVSEAEVFVVEMSPRPSGHYLHDIFLPCAIGMDMIEEFVKFLSGKDYCFEIKDTKRIRIQYFDLGEGQVRKIPDKEEILQENNVLAYQCNISCGQILEKVIDGQSLMHRGYFIVRGESEEELDRQCDDILNQFQMEGVNNGIYRKE